MSELNFEKYASEQASKKLFYKIGLIGPSRVGKTSIIAALLEEAKVALAKSRVSITPFFDEDGTSVTDDRITNTIYDIESGLDECSFEPTGMGTADPFIFDLVMMIADRNEDENKIQLHLAILDYPGGWLKKIRAKQVNSSQQTLKKCQEWIKDSSVIIVPIDANLIMEADNKERRTAARELLQINDIKELVEDWSKQRRFQQESGLLLFVPVKCETYFNDNGGYHNKSEELYKRYENFYGDVFKIAKEVMSQNKDEKSETSQSDGFNAIIRRFKKLNQKTATFIIEYHPIDTIGCIEVENAKWKDIDGQLSLECEYLVRNAGDSRPQRKPLGTIGLLNSICKQIVQNRQNRGFFGKFWDLLQAKDQLLANAIQELSSQQYGPRYRQIANENIGKQD